MVGVSAGAIAGDSLIILENCHGKRFATHPGTQLSRFSFCPASDFGEASGTYQLPL